ncbi:MAG: hypothetical protein ACR2PZ_03265 [Pseudomonadales bacterium]
MTQKPTTSDLLALRDGEPLSAETRQRIANDQQASAQLALLQRVKSELNALPDVQPDEDSWEQLQQQLAQRQAARASEQNEMPIVESLPVTRGWRLPYPMATAAGVFFAAVMLSTLWLPQLGTNVPGSSAPANGPEPLVAANSTDGARAPTVAVDTMGALIDRSRRLEAVARLPVARAIDGQERSRQALLYRIADLDAELNSLIEEQPMDPALKEKLWQQRVELLETLVAIQQDQLRRSSSLY